MWVAAKRVCRGVTGNATPPSRRASDHSLQVIRRMLVAAVDKKTGGNDHELAEKIASRHLAATGWTCYHAHYDHAVL